MEKIRAAVIGCGAISRAYMNNLKNRFSIIELAACCDLREERAAAAAAEYGISAMSLEAVLSDPSIDMVIDLTNPSAHYAINKAALEAGKHVYSEKMLANTAKEGRELYSIAESKGLLLGTAPDTFLGAALQTARYVIDRGLIGKPLSFTVSLSRDYEIFGEILPHLTKPGGSITWDVSCYYLTALASLLGPAEKITGFTATNEPARVNSRVGSTDFGKEYTIEVENIAAMSVVYKSGVIGTVHLNSDCIFDEDRVLKIFGTEGILSLDDPNQFGSTLRLKKPFHDDVIFPFTHGFENESRGLGAAEMAWSLRAGRKPRTDARMNIHLLDMMEGLLESSATEKVVHIESTFDQPAPLPAGYVTREEYGFFSPTEESALV
ncbi:MAG: Gfo/Idh/MocA family oxidoreductase [Clostridia bacterium]|nr:Gfo/Idh/MocA family oxidoreductase [Clostridia bacterium]